MKKRILLLLVAMIGLATSVGWAGNISADIKTDLEVAQKGKPIVFSVTTQKGSEDKTVRVELKMNADTDLSGWKMEYYEANQQPNGWKDWTPENGVYMYGPANGFPLIDGTSYFRMTPATAGEYTYSLSIKEASGGTVVKTADFSLTVSENADAPTVSIGNENYASLSAAVASAAENATINLSEGHFFLDRMLVINKPLSIKAVDPIKTIIQPLDPHNWIIPSGMIEGENKHLVAILGDATGTVTLENVTVGSSLASGINAQSAMKTVLNNVYLSGNANAGLLVHSTVEATGLHTQQNVWGAVNVDNSTKTSYTVSFKFDAASLFEEPAKIWSEVTDNENIVIAPEGWTSYLGKGGVDNTTDMRYWKNSKLTLEKGTINNTQFIYANGNPVTIEGVADKKVRISLSESDFIELAESENPVIFGGSKEGTVTSSNITMKSGTVYRLYGGGYGTAEGKSASVTETTTLIITGGTVSNSMFGGGRFYAHSKDVVINISGNTFIGDPAGKGNYWLICGGDENGKTSGGNYVEFDQSNNTVESATLNINGGTYSLIALGGTDGAKGYIKNVTADIKNATITGGIYGNGSNGRSDKVVGSLTNCTFKKSTYPIEIAAVNRGKSKEISLTFDNCTFPDQATDIYAYLGATYNTLLGYQGSEYGVPESVNFVFKGTKAFPEVGVSDGLGSANVTLTGAKGYIKPFVASSSSTIKAFTIPEGKTWAFNNGLEIANDVTLTNNGTLSVPLDNVMTAIAVEGTIQIKATANEVVTEMNKATNKADLSSKATIIECSDAVIATNETKAKELLKAGRNVQLLAYDGQKGYTISTYVKTLATITNLPESVVYGTEPITLAFNMENVTAAIDGSSSDVASLATEEQSQKLTILKPGTVTLNLTVSGNDDAANTQTLEVTKKMLTVSGITATARDYNGGTDITLVTDQMVVNGLVGDDTGANILNTPTGKLSSANAGDAVPVEVTATLKSKNDYYDLAEITGVTAKINKVALTVTATTPSEINFGAEIPTFAATASGFVNSEDNEALGGKLEFDCPATTTSLAGEYSVTPFGYTSQNYTITYKAAQLKINAIAPTAELTGVKVNSVGANASVTVSGRVLSNGGTQTDKLVAKLEAKMGNQTTKTVDDIKVNADGTFAADITGLTSAAYTVDLTVSDSKELTSEKVTSSSIALNAKLQNIHFTTELNRLVYGSTASILAEGYAEGATVEYTTSSAAVLDFNADKTEVIAKSAGQATITVTATLDQYVTAVAKQTITVEPKTLTVTPTVASKTYDGTNTADVTYKVNGLVNNDAITVAKVDATYADANCGVDKRITLSEPLKLSGEKKTNYQLVQPTDLKGSIGKAGNLVVKATNVSRKYNDPVNALKYDLEVEGFVNNETLTTAMRTGAIIVTEGPEGSYTIDVSKVSFPNYSTITANGGKVDIIKGTPKVITVNTTNASGVTGVLVDAEGWEGLTVQIGNGSDSKKYAYVNYGNTQISRGVELAAAQATLPTISWTQKATTNSLTKAAVVVDKEFTYDESATFTGVSGYTVESSNPNILTVEGSAASRTVKAVGVGNAALIFTKDGAVSSMTVKVNPKTIKLTATGTNKSYDGTTTANILLSATGMVDAALDLKDITFDYASKDAKDNIAIYPSKTILLQGANASNYQLETASLKGKITPSELKVTSAVSKYYDGTNKVVLNTYSAEGLAAGEEVPLTATFASIEVKTDIDITWSALSGNYTMGTSTSKGNIIKSTLEAKLPSSASSESDVKNKITYVIRETGAEITGAEAKAISAKVNVVKTGTNSFLVNGGDTDNYTIAYPTNSIGFKSGPVNPGTGTDPDVDVTGVSLDKSELTLAVKGTYTLKATVAPADADNKSVTWKSSDDKIATVDKDGKVTAVAIGKATITVTTEDGGKTATCVVTVDAATGLEELIANTRVYGQDHAIRIEPAMSVNVLVVSMNGQLIYNDIVSSATQIPVPAAGIYIVKLGTGNDTSVRKVSVK